MKMNAGIVLIAMLMLPFLFSCKAYRDIEKINPKTSNEMKAGSFDKASLSKLVPGEKMIIITQSGFEYSMTFSNLDEVNIVGSVQKVNKSRVLVEEIKEIPISEIDTLYVKRVSAGATAPVLLLAGGAVFFVVLIIALASSDGFW